MKNYYSIIQLSPNPAANESLAIGLIIVTANHIWLRFADEKIRIANQFMSLDNNLIDYVVNHITKTIQEQNNLLSETSKRSILFNSDKLFFNENYISYLNRYSNNIIQFSEPIEIQTTIQQSVFDSFFRTLISDKASERKSNLKDKSFFNRINQKLIQRVQEKVHIHQKFTKEILPSLYFNYEMDCIGMNGVITGAKSINFEKSSSTIDTQLSHYFTLTDLLTGSYQKTKEDNNFYLIADEPQDRKSKEHQIYSSLKHQHKIQIISSEECAIVAEKIDSTGAKPFLTMN